MVNDPSPRERPGGDLEGLEGTFSDVKILKLSCFSPGNLMFRAHNPFPHGFLITQYEFHPILTTGTLVYSNPMFFGPFLGPVFGLQTLINHVSGSPRRLRRLSQGSRYSAGPPMSSSVHNQKKYGRPGTHFFPVRRTPCQHVLSY